MMAAAVAASHNAAMKNLMARMGLGIMHFIPRGDYTCASESGAEAGEDESESHCAEYGFSRPRSRASSGLLVLSFCAATSFQERIRVLAHFPDGV